MKRTLSLLLALIMVVTMIPTVFAETDKPGVGFDDLYYQKLDSYTPIAANIAANQEQGYIWTATEEGTLAYTVPAACTMTLTQGEQTATGTGTVSLEIVAGQDVTIVLVNTTDAAVNQSITGTLTPPVTNAITKHPENVTGINIGDDVTFTVEATGATAYQWMRRTATGGWKVLTGETEATYTFTAVENDEYLYACKVTFGDGSYVVSNTATYAATWKFEIYAQSPATQQVVAGTNIRLSVSAHGYDLTYKWMRRQPTGGWTVLRHDENPVYTFKAEKGDKTIHMCQVFNGEGKNIKSNEFTYTTYPFAEISNQTTEIAEYKPGEDVTFFVETTKDGQAGVTYQWYSSYSRYKSWKTLTGETGPTLTFPAKPYDAEKGTGEKLYYICIIWDEYNNRTVSGVMEYSCVTDLEISPVTNPDGDKVYVNGEPVTFTFTTTLDGQEGVRYQWLKRTPTGGWGVVKGATDKTMTIPAEEGNIRLFACKVFDKYGCWKLSDVVTYTAVAPMEIKVNTQNATAVAGEQVRFYFEVEGVNGQSVTYRWLSRQSSSSAWKVMTGETENELVVTAVAGNKYQYLCQAFDEYNNKISSNIVTYTAN